MTVQFPHVTATEIGFTLAGGRHKPLEVEWSNVVEIVAFKRDCFAHDVICLGFRLVGDDEFTEVAEDFPGYGEFLKAVEMQFTLSEHW